MHSTDLKSKQWCDIVFEHRNKAYGAYRLRQQAGARYRYALITICMGICILIVGYAMYNLQVKKNRKNSLDRAEKLLLDMLPQELNSGYQIKMVSTARITPSAPAGEGDKVQGAPVIVDEVTHPMTTGVKQAFRFHINAQWADDVVTDLYPDTLGESNVRVKQQIVRTDDVSELPQFPGGPRALMHWLDENIVYPPYCQQRGLEGEVTVSFMIRQDGYPYDFKVEKATNELFAETTLNVLKRMPQWKPARSPQGEPTAAMITIPVLFRR